MTNIPAPPSTPRERLLASKTLVEAHQQIIGHGLFDNVADMALLEYQRQLIHLTSQDPQGLNAAAASHLKIAGATEFLRILRGLSNTPEAPRVKAVGNLDHRV